MGTKARKAAAWALMTVFLLASAPLQAGKRRGARVVVERKDGTSVSGELLMVKRDGLVVDCLSGGAIVGLGDVRSVRIARKSKAGAGMMIGFFGGTLLALGISSSSQESNGLVMDVGLSALFFGLPAGGLGMGHKKIGKAFGMGGNSCLLRRDWIAAGWKCIMALPAGQGGR